MKSIAFAALLLGSAVALSACGGDGRAEPGGSVFDPLCMPDGSVVLYEYARTDGTYDTTTAKKENCPWFKR